MCRLAGLCMIASLLLSVGAPTAQAGLLERFTACVAIMLEPHYQKLIVNRQRSKLVFGPVTLSFAEKLGSGYFGSVYRVEKITGDDRLEALLRRMPLAAKIHNTVRVLGREVQTPMAEE